MLVGRAVLVAGTCCLSHVLLGCGQLHCGDPHPESEFCEDGATVLKFSSGGAFGYCPREDEVESAVIVVDGQGRYRACGTALVEGVLFLCGDSCVGPDFDPERCLVRRRLAEVVLTDDQAAELDQLIADIPPKACSDDPVATDWCLVTSYEFLDRAETGVCTFGYVNEDFSLGVNAVEEFVEGILTGK